MADGEGRYRLIVFDWDGTLFDSAEGIVESIRSAAGDLGVPLPAHERARHVIGLGLEDSLRLAVPELPRARYGEFVDRYREHFREREKTMSLFPGVRELIGALRGRGRQLAVATGKSRRGLDRALASSGLHAQFVASRCGDETAPKPHPAMLLEILAELAVEPARALMVGDTSHDLEMARRAGVDALAVSYGAHARPALDAHAPRDCVASVEELDEWLRRHA